MCSYQSYGITITVYSVQENPHLYVVFNALYELHHALPLPVWPTGNAEAPAVVLQHGLANAQLFGSLLDW